MTSYDSRPDPSAGSASSATTPRRVLVADDQELVRAGFRLILEASGFVVVGEAADGAQALSLAAAPALPAIDPAGTASWSPVGPGYGLAGIAERVASCGGSLALGPAAGGGFTVTARLPIGHV